MARLGLDERKAEHKQLYTMMKVGPHICLFPQRTTGVNVTSLFSFCIRREPLTTVKGRSQHWPAQNDGHAERSARRQ